MLTKRERPWLFMINEETVKETLRGVKYPGFSRDIVSFGMVKEIQSQNETISVTIALTSPKQEVASQIKADCEQALQNLAGANKVNVDVQVPSGQQQQSGSSQQQHAQKVTGIKRIIAVASGKGGVGKSTASVNLACSLQHLGNRVGLLDCDIYGPSIPLMMGINQRPTLNDSEQIIPLTNYGIKLMSMGFLLDGDSPVIWRGPMIQKTIQQFIGSVDWGELDYLLVDLPPGTGDAQLSLCQTVPLSGGIIVTTPQEASLGVVRKGIGMFGKVNVPILGIVENMSYYITPSGERVEIFGYGGGKTEAERQGVPFLGEIPIYTEIREAGDKGVPVLSDAPDSAPSRAFIAIAETLQKNLNR